jgi:hypothetical protein
MAGLGAEIVGIVDDEVAFELRRRKIVQRISPIPVRFS